MKRTNAPPIPEGIRITLNGEEQEWKDVMQVFEDAGWVWVSGTKPHEKKICSYSTVETSSNKKIANCACVPITQELTATEFLQQYQCTIEYEVGDWVVILVDQSGDPEGTVTQVVHVDGNSVYAKNISRSGTSITNWSATVDSIRPATPEEIPYDTKVASKDPDVYIWDGDVLPDEYVIQNPTPNKDNQELAELLNMATGNKQGWRGNAIYGYLINKEGSKPTYAIDSVGIPIVPYELWKSILEQPVSQAEPVKERMFEKGDRVKVVRGSYEGCIGSIADIGGARSLYYVILDGGDQSWFFSGEEGTGVDIVHYTEEPVAIKPRYHIDNVMDQNIAISCPTIELWNAVTGLIPNNNRLTEENWKDYNSNDEIAGCNINQFGGNHCDISWYEDEKYTIITAGEFLRDNGVAVPQPRWSIVTTDGVTVYESGDIWLIKPDQKSKQEEKSQTIINKQSKTKQNEKGNSISITEQCIVINSNYINCKTSNATYVPGDEERITKGQRRQGSTVRG